MRIRLKTVQVLRRLHTYDMRKYDNKLSYNIPTIEFHRVLQRTTEITLVSRPKVRHLKR